MSKNFNIKVTGDKELQRTINKLVGSGMSPAHINKAMDDATEGAVKSIVKPKVMSRVPVDSGKLRANVVVEKTKRGDSTVGYSVGLKDSGSSQGMRNPLFSGDTFYGGLLEFGFRFVDGSSHPPDQWLRIPLYSSQSQVLNKIKSALRGWIKRAGRV